MNSNMSTLMQIPQDFPILIKETSIEKMKGNKIRSKNSSSSYKKKQLNSDSSSSNTSQLQKLQDFELLSCQNFYQINQNAQQISQNSQILNKNSSQINKNPQYLSQNSIFYENDILPSYNYFDNQLDINGDFIIKQNNFDEQLAQNNYQIGDNQLSIRQKKKSSKQSNNQNNEMKLLEQNSNKIQQQQQLIFDNEILIPNMHKKQLQCSQFNDENNIYNHNSNLEQLQFDKIFSINQVKINNNSSQNIYNQISNNQNLSSFITINDNILQNQDICPFNQLQQEIVSQTQVKSPVIYSYEEPRYVNAAQFKRMMIMRIKRAAKNLKQPKVVPIKQKPKQTSQKNYKYESRHKHATNRIRDSKGRFIPKDQLQEYLEQLEKENKEKDIQDVQKKNQ